MKKLIWILGNGLSLFMLVGIANAQNLIPNHEFINRDTTYCTQPPLAFHMLSDWYNLGGTPYHFVKGCPIPAVFKPLGDSDQADYAGLSSNLLALGFASTQGFAAQLIEPLEAGKRYYFEFSYINLGIRHHIDSLLRECDTSPKRRLEVYLDRDSIPHIHQLAFNPSFTLTEPGFYQSLPTPNWAPLGTCFEAEGGESFIGFTHLRGPFEFSAPCEYSPIANHYFNWQSHLLDRFILEAFPDTFQATYIVCLNGKGIAFDAEEAFDFRALKDLTFKWEDGFEGGKRELSQAGIYHVTAQLACGPHPLKVTILEKDCDPYVEVANAFSPNQDGINESIVPMLDVGIPLNSYEWAIYDRWGRKVFLTNRSGDVWNGNSAGQSQPAGVYAWRLTFTLMREGRIRTYTRFGNITLIR